MNNKIIAKEATGALLTQQKGKLNESEIGSLLNESCDILSRCNPPGANIQKAGLVVGYVQSGKTLSLTTVSSLARDNGYGMVIVMCGVTKILFKQNSDRLHHELVEGMHKRFFSSVRPPYKTDDISASLTQWHSNKDNPTLLIFVLKNKKNINKLAEVLSKSRQGVHAKTPTLIIDDEAHMAGLNTMHEAGSESEVYAAMKLLRATLPDNTYLQYTATPQAPLLVQVADCVSPDFAVTLTPGSGYVGGKDIFNDSASASFVRTIPELELPGSEGIEDAAPDSLRSALLCYLVGLSDGIAKGESQINRKNRTMLIHPASRVNSHDLYAGHVKTLLQEFDVTLGIHAERSSRDELTSQIQTAYSDLATTHTEICQFSEIMRNFPDAILKASARIQKLNGQQINLVDWSDYAHILVGGEVLGVGFTVEGLTVTYMPREASGGQSDSMQQRARFLGYRKGYLGLMRIFLSEADQDLYASYTQHEEEMRSELKKMSAANKTIKEWKRNFLIHSNMRLTRVNIQSLETERHRLEQRCYPKKPFECDYNNNQEVFAKIRRIYDFKLDYAYKQSWGPAQRHESVYVPILEALNLLDEFTWSDADDSLTWSVSSIILKAIEKNGDLGKTCKITLMSPGEHRRSREVIDNEWKSIFQGRSPGGAPDSYQGDHSIEDQSCLTIQIYDYTMNMKYTEGSPERVIKSVIVPVVIPTDEMISQLDLIRQ
jgi:Z1 domain